MASRDSWAGYGLDEATLRAIRDSARRAGMSIEDWLATAISERVGADAGRENPPGRQGAPGEDLAAIADAVARLSARVEERERPARRVEREPARPADAAAIGRMVDSLDRRVEALSGAPLRNEPLAAGDKLEVALRRLEAKIAENRRAARSGPARPSGTLAAAIAEINDRQRAIDEEGRAAAAPRPASPSARVAREEIEGLRSEIGGLARLIGNLARERNEPQQRAHQAEAEGLAKLVARLDQIEAALGETARESTLGTIEAGYGHIIERLDALARQVPAIDQGDIRRLEDRLDALAHQAPAVSEGDIQRLEDRLDALLRQAPAVDQGDIRRLEDRLDALAHQAPAVSEGDIQRLEDRLDAISAEMRNLGSPAEFSGIVGRLESRLVEIATTVVEMHRIASADVEPALDRLNRRVADIAARLDAVSAAPADEAFAELGGRLEALAERIERIAAGQDRPAAMLGQLHNEITALRQALAERAQPDTEALEAEIRALADRLDRASQGTADAEALAQLEAQVAALAGRLDDFGQRPAAFARIEENLAELQAVLATTQRDAVESARDVARAAVREFAATADDESNPLIGALKADLRNLQSAASTADARNQETLEAVHDTLEKVIARLARLERSTEADADDVGLLATGTETARAGSLLGASMAVPSAELHVPARDPLPEDHRPLEPGSGKPDVFTGRVSGAPRRPGIDSKADFIAAARRAAQAAAAESAEMKNEAGEGRSGPLSRIGQALLNRKRPLLLAAAAVVLTLAAMQLYPVAESALQSRLAARPDRPAETAAASGPVAASLGGSTKRAAAAGNDGAIRDILADAAAGRPISGGLAPEVISAPETFAAPGTVAARFEAEPQTLPTGGFSGALAEPRPDPIVTGSIGLDPATVTPIKVSAPRLAEAAAGGDPAAMFEIGARYAEGRGIAQDIPEAARWYERAANRGLAMAQFRLASLYERGQGIAADRNLASLWYEKAARQGNARAMHNLAVMLAEGIRDEPDYERAMSWFISAAEHGVTDSQYNLGVIYARGLGAAQDLVASYKWFALAAAAGDGDAGKRRDEVAGVMQPEQLAAARAAVQAFSTKPIDKAANNPPASTWDRAPVNAGLPDAMAMPASLAATSAGDLVREAQILLNAKGFKVGSADGKIGPMTRQAVRAFQRSAGLAETGEIDRGLIDALKTHAI